MQHNLHFKETSMSLRTVPSEDEVIGWNAQTLADYMRKLKLSSCDKVVLRNNITGSQFMRMTHCELGVFPGISIPTLISIQRQIKMGVKRRDVVPKSKTKKLPEVPYQKDEDEEYICALAALQTKEEQHSDKTTGGNYTLPNFTRSMKPERDVPVQKPRGALYSDLNKKIKKPELPGLHPIPTTKSKGSIVFPPKVPFARSPKQALMPPGMTPSVPRMNSVTSYPPMAEKISAPPIQYSDVLIGTTHSQYRDLDPSWYGGKVTRSHAEMVLRELNKDGAFLVRETSKSSTDHAYTLMILNKGKVYNIKIRKEGNSYLLGNGIRNLQSFPGVPEMINHYTYTPLLLIDGRDQTSGEEPKCLLKHPVRL